jgi:hypothetical protein
MKLQRTLRCLLALLACWCLTSCGGRASDTVADASVRIHVMAAPFGRLEPLPAAPGAAPAWKLVLRQPYPQAIWYADRPLREAGTTPLADYVRSTWSQAYGDTPPNATVHFQLDGSDELERAFVSLSQPAYDDETDTLSFRVEILASSPVQLSAGPLSLRQVSMNVLNNAERGKTVASYVQYAEQAAWRSTSIPGQHRLVMGRADPETLMVSNAPAQYHEIRSTEAFTEQWADRFGASPPNAAILGFTASGEMRLEFLTLSAPVFDPGTGQLSYTVTSIDGFSTPPEPLTQVVLNIDTAAVSRFPSPGKGSAYQAFGHGYDPSAANTTAIYFGSDIARRQMGSLWGKTSYLLQSCEPHCRDDLQTMKAMGINLIRLYDWDTRNDHSQFLDYAHSLNLKVIVPISNWLATNPQYWAEQVPAYFTRRNFGNSTGRDWHPAIAGVTISNELDLVGVAAYGNAIGLAARFLDEATTRGFSREVRVGVPVSFQGQNGKLPAWDAFDRLASDPRLSGHRAQLMLNANTYNDRHYLFVDANGAGRGWVQQTWDRYQLPVLFTEIGQSRVSNANADDTVREQLLGVLDHQRAHPDQLLGAIHFQFDNKVWKQSPDGAPETDSEGAFGAFRHGAVVLTLQTVAQDFDFYAGTASYGSFTIDQLLPTSTHQAVVDVYRQP